MCYPELYIGDNGAGKTRVLASKINDAILAGKIVITNLPMLDCNYTVDHAKINLLDKAHNPVMQIIADGDQPDNKRMHDLKNLFNLICAKGDVLVLDELDAFLNQQEVVFFATAISDVSSLWEEIYVSGYDSGLMTMFSIIDPDTNEERYVQRLYVVSDNMNVTQITEEDNICEYFTAIRG